MTSWETQLLLLLFSVWSVYVKKMLAFLFLYTKSMAFKNMCKVWALINFPLIYEGKNRLFRFPDFRQNYLSASAINGYPSALCRAMFHGACNVGSWLITQEPSKRSCHAAGCKWVEEWDALIHSSAGTVSGLRNTIFCKSSFRVPMELKVNSRCDRTEEAERRGISRYRW